MRLTVRRPGEAAAKLKAVLSAEELQESAMKGIMGYPGKDTTYVLDFVNDSNEVLESFKTYHKTAELANVTDRYLILNLRAKLDGTGHYDEFEVNRVVAVELKPNAKQSELAAAVEPVVDRLHKKYKAAQAALKIAKEKNDTAAAEIAQNELKALLLFQSDMGAFQRL